MLLKHPVLFVQQYESIVYKALYIYYAVLASNSPPFYFFLPFEFQTAEELAKEKLYMSLYFFLKEYGKNVRFLVQGVQLIL